MCIGVYTLILHLHQFYLADFVKIKGLCKNGRYSIPNGIEKNNRFNCDLPYPPVSFLPYNPGRFLPKCQTMIRCFPRQITAFHFATRQVYLNRGHLHSCMNGQSVIFLQKATLRVSSGLQKYLIGKYL